MKDTKTKQSKEKDRKILEEALERFKFCSDAESDIRKEALIDLKFKAGQQWEENISATRQSESRPCLTINRLPQFIRQVTNDQRMNRPAIRISPTDDSTKDKAEILEGLIRHIQVKSSADIAYDTACDFQVTMGFGYIRVCTDYVSEKSFEQEILIKEVKNPFSVYLDPLGTRLDHKYGFVIEDVNKEDFIREYGEDKVPGEIYTAQGDDLPSWASDKTVRVAEYWVVIEKAKTIYLLSDGNVVDELPEGVMEETGESSEEEDSETQDMQLAEAASGVESLTVVNKRESTERKVMWYKITADEILDRKEWPGKYIPIVPVLGDDITIDGKRMLIGMVRFARDPQRMYNYWASAQAEAIALAPKAPFIVAEGQLENYEKVWATANVRSHAFLTYRPVTQDGVMLPPPQRNQAEPPVQAMVQALAQAAEDLKNTTGIHDASLGARSNETSGKAILARQKEGDVSNFHFQDNLSRSIQDVGQIAKDLIPHIYDTPRVVRILHENRDEELIKINEMFEHRGEMKEYDMTSGEYDVVVETGPSYSTKREEAAQNILNISQSNPTIWQWAPDILFQNMDMAGSRELAERAKLILPPEIQNAANKDQVKIPPQIQQQLMQSQQRIQQLTQALNAAHDKIETKALEIESKEKIAAQNNETKLALEEMRHNITIFNQEVAHLQERLRLEQSDRHVMMSNMQAQQQMAQSQEEIPLG